ncbi:PREDICTED: B3 domain-containing protein At2g33720-like [Nelumbo nucifera]|uniref:B3 domain-containing protein At2g33720-like n=2 Tax=Nelumbo nucifera TaxID=4432 RepID=A0A822YHS9_NELNU|nr:PREDICTED: B3 domain-containing protein At2g33720-like [Nelumbo nucifera]DAD33744.1 TPA_asm: hypothetical protein HUJ06_012595 [Nelumbo nucifera]
MNPRHNLPERGDQSDDLFRIDPAAVERMNRYHDRPRGLNDDHFGISTELKLHENPWVLKKTLTISYVDNLSRLMLKKVLVQAYILSFMEGEQVEEVNNGAGTRVQIKDLDTGSDHELTLRMWPASKCYVLNDNWRESFVRRRELNAGDEIWMYWDRYYRCFFTVRGRVVQIN